MQNNKQYELYKELHGLTKQRHLHHKPACPKDTKEGNKEMYRVLITGQDPTQERS